MEHASHIAALSVALALTSFQVVFGDGLDERTLLRAQTEGREGFVGLTLNEGENLLFAQKVREHERGARSWVAMHSGHMGVKKEHTGEHGRVLFGEERNLDAWAARYDKGQVRLERWRLDAPQVDSSAPRAGGEWEELLLPVLWGRDGRMQLYDDTVRPVSGDEVDLAFSDERADEARTWLESHGWRREAYQPAEEASA